MGAARPSVLFRGGRGTKLSTRERRLNRRPRRIESLESRSLLAGDAIISEFMAVNEATIRDGFGDASDWIEIYNPGDSAVDLSGWHLTDDPSDLAKWSFPESSSLNLNAGQYLVVFASGRDSQVPDPAGWWHTSFRLNAESEYVALVRPDGVSVASEYGSNGSDYPPQREDVSYGLGYVAASVTMVPRKAPANVIVPTAESDIRYGDSWKGGDETAFRDAGGLTGWTRGTTTGVGFHTNSEYSGMVGTDLTESMYNVGTSAYIRIPFTVDNPSAVSRLTLRMLYDDAFVAYLNGTEIARRNVTGTPTWDASVPTVNHLADDFEEFDISSNTGALTPGSNILAIHGINRTRRSSGFLIFPELIAEVTTGAAEVGYFPTASPGSANRTAVDGFVESPQFSAERGLYFAPLDVKFSSDTPGATLVYTTDGSTPTATHGSQVPAPDVTAPPVATIHVETTTTLRVMAMKPGYEATPVATHTYLFLADVANQPANPEGYPSTWAGTRADYEVDPDVTGNPLYRDTFVDDLSSIPIVSLVTDVEHLFDTENGIYVNPLERGVTWERPVSVELLNFPEQQALQIDAGVRIFGGVSRRLDRTPKKSFRLQFKSTYGAAQLEFPVFDNSTVHEFDRLMLRGGYNYKWTHSDSTQQARAQYLRDEFSRASQLAMGQPASHGRYVHVYLNGLYWGMYNLVERPDESFAASYFGGDKEDYDVVKHGEPPEAINGDRVAWDEMFAIAKDNQRTAEQKYVDIQQYLDIDNLIDYMIMIHYTGNVDAPVLIGSTTAPRNFYAIRPRADGGQFQFFLWDSEHSLSEITVDRTELGVGNADDTPARLYGELRASAEFRLRFADRVHAHFFNDGALTVQAIIQRYRTLAAQIDRAVVGESARWGDVRRSTRPYTRDAEWIREQNRLLDNFFPRRHDVVLDQWRADGLYPDVEAPLLNQNGGSFVDVQVVTLSVPTGEIYFTLDGSDPRDVATKLPSATARLWDGDSIVLADSTRIHARSIDQGQWSALTAATFLRVEPPGLRISELMYHPADPPGSSATEIEFIELTNVGETAIDVSGFQLAGGIQFAFPQTTVGPSEYVVVVSNQAEYVRHYGQAARIAGEFDGQLSNAGESIQLVSSIGQMILEFAYEDDWYSATDGEGYSLVALDPLANPERWSFKENWRPSDAVDGSPGQADLMGAALIDRVAADIRFGRSRADLNSDGKLDERDLQYLVHDLLETRFGDANLDRRFDSSDLVQVFIQGEYEDHLTGNSTWAEGDWNGDGEFSSEDLVLAMQDGGYVVAATVRLPPASGGHLPGA